MEGNMMIDIDATVFDKSPIWLELFDVSESPAIHLTPLDWTDYEFARRMSLVVGTNVVKPATMLAQLVQRTQPDAWRGFERQGQPVPFDADLLLNLLCSNVELGVRFDLKLKALAEGQRRQDEADLKNSSAGPGTQVTAPGKKSAKVPASA
jgi:hypothetical protein